MKKTFAYALLILTALYSCEEGKQEEPVLPGTTPDCINIEEAHNFSCFMTSEANYYTKFNLSAGMRGSADKRIAYYEKMLQMGVITINEVRAMEEMNGTMPL